ncbi:MAG: hypothetical protein KF723_22960 [Rhizobiaceae bacterium]|nr:hypothetical protein [Rhizobiaceae bacterium]
MSPREAAIGGMAELEKLVAGNGWDFFAQQFAPANVADDFRPVDPILQALARMYEFPETRAVIDWILDLSVRAPYPRGESTTEELGIAAAKHQARAAVGEAIVKAIVEGRKINAEPRK